MIARIRAYVATRRSLVWVLAATLVARLATLILAASPTLSHDELGYHEMVRQLLDRGVFGIYGTTPNAFVTPGYPLFMAVIYKITALLGGSAGAQVASVRAVQMLLGVATVAVVYEIAHRLFADKRTALLAAIFVAVYPSAFMAQMRLLTETTYTFVLCVYALSILGLFSRRSPRGHVVTGVWLGIATLIRPAVAPLIVLPYLVDLVLRRDRRFLLSGAIAVLAWAAIMTPWWVRNVVTLHEFIPLATQSGNPMLRGADPWDPYDHNGPSVIEGVPEKDMSRVAKERIARGLKEDPALWIGWFTYGKTAWLWGMPWALDPWISKPIHWVVILVLGVPGALMALWRLFRSALKRVGAGSADGLSVEGLGWLALVALATTVLQLLFIPIPRYMYPMTPLMSVFAGGVAMAVWDWLRSRSARSA